MKTLMTATSLAVLLAAGGALAADPADLGACAKLVDEIAEVAENKQLSDADTAAIGDLLTIMMTQCEAGRFNDAGQSAAKLKGMVGG